MKRTITEQSVLFASVIKWIVLGACTGIIVGLATTAFLRLLAWATAQGDPYAYTFLLLPIAFWISALLTTRVAPDAQGHGTEKVIEAIHKHGSVIPAAVVPVKLVATIITLAVGGSAGKEGPCAQIGAGLSSLFARLLRFDENDRKKLVICGISAGFATVFGTPIAGAIFGVEVLIVGTLLYDVLLPSFVAGVTAFQVASFFGISHIHIPVTCSGAGGILLMKVILAAILFGVVSVLLIQGMEEGRRLSDRFGHRPLRKAAGAGCLLALMAMMFGRRYLGLGMPTIVSCLNGQDVSWIVPFMKIAFTVITLNGGGSGGIVTPIFFIGATAGAAIAPVFHVDPAFMSAIGLVCLLAGAANTPIAASIMAVEMFGPSIGPYAGIGCVVTYLMSGHRSVYPSQLIAIRKSSSLEVPLGAEMQDVSASYLRRRKTVIHALAALWAYLAGKFRALRRAGSGRPAR